MSETGFWGELKETVRLFTVWAITCFLDSLFLALWVAVQWGVNTKILVPLKLSGIDQWVLLAFQVLFSISTLAPVAITVYRDICIMLLRTQRRIQKEIEMGARDER